DDRARAPALGLFQALSACGNIAAGFIGMAVGAAATLRLLPFDLKPWQVLFLIGALPAFLSVFVMLKLKEPERWMRARDEGERRGLKLGSYVALLSDVRWRGHAWLGLIACSAGIIGLWGIGNFHPKIVGAIIESELAPLRLPADAIASRKAYWRSVGLLLQNVGGFVGMLALAKVAHLRGRRVAYALALLLS